MGQCKYRDGGDKEWAINQPGDSGDCPELRLGK